MTNPLNSLRNSIHIIIFFVMIHVPSTGSCQESKIIVSGIVLDARTRQPLSNATVEVGSRDLKIMVLADGKFRFDLPVDAAMDSLEVSYVGFKPYKKRISELKNDEEILLQDYSIELRTVTITSRNLKLKEIDRQLRQIRGNIYAYTTETTNAMYNLFLGSLEENGQTELLKQCAPDLSKYKEEDKKFYERYAAPYRPPLNKKDTSLTDFTRFPVVNISHDAAAIFCEWLTQQYNASPEKKKFKKVKFRLPTLNEWQIAALGYPEFQSWNLTENKVEVFIPADTVTVEKKGKLTVINVDREIMYPWYTSYNYRKKPLNQFYCYLGNFKAIPYGQPCGGINRPGHDGWIRMSFVAAYFPNHIGLYDVVGNVAEMIDVKGKACGGSWNDHPKESTIHSVKNYRRPDDTIGFRVFMEVEE